MLQSDQLFNNSVVNGAIRMGHELSCLSTAGNGDLIWESDNPLVNNYLVNFRSNSSTPHLSVDTSYMEAAITDQWSITIMFGGETYSQSFNGVYRCRSMQSGTFSSVVLAQGDL